MNDPIQWAIIAVILSGIFVAWRAGQANPESTGKLGKEVSGINGRLSDLSGRVKHVEGEVRELKEEAATVKDIQRVEQLFEERFNTFEAKLNGQRELSQATNHSVDRIERILIERSLAK